MRSILGKVSIELVYNLKPIIMEGKAEATGFDSNTIEKEQHLISAK